MTSPDSPGSVPMDARDLGLLSELLGVFDALDPMPEHLPELVVFALSMENLDAEMARLIESEGVIAGTRSGAQVEHARRITFNSEHLTVMVAVEPEPGGRSVRIDGWAAPGGGLRVELRSGDQLMTGDCDQDGRFCFDCVPTGSAQLTLSPTAASDPTVRIPVVTPAVNL